MVQKGKVSAVLNNGTAVTITPYGGGIVTAAMTVPPFLVGALSVNTPVVYVTFDDNTGLILSRMDGEWAEGVGGSSLAVATDGDAIIISTNASSKNGGVSEIIGGV